MRTSSDHSAHVEPLTWRDGVAIVRVLIGVVLALVAFLLLTTAPEIVFRWLHRDGYRATEVDVARVSNSTVKVAFPTGEAITMKSSRASGHMGPQTAYYNPDARLIMGISLMDERVVFTGIPQSAAEGLMPTVIMLACGAAAFWLLRGSPEKPRQPRRARKNRGSA